MKLDAGRRIGRKPIARLFRVGAKEAKSLDVRARPVDVARYTIGDLGAAVRVTGEGRATLVIDVDPAEAIGIERTSVKVFRLDERRREFRPIWRSGYNAALGFAWAEIGRPGTYLPIGLPQDGLIRDALRRAALRRREDEDEDADPKGRVPLHRRELASLLEAPAEELEEARGILATIQAKTELGGVPEEDLVYREGGHLAGIRPPRGGTFDDFRKRLEALDPGPQGLPEEVLFFPPDDVAGSGPPWATRPDVLWDGLAKVWLDPVRKFDWLDRICLFLSRDWWMYHADAQHTGRARGCSDLSSSNVSRLRLQSVVPLDGDVVTIPAIVGGKIYVGSSKSGGGTLFKIDLATGTKDPEFPVAGYATYSYDGIGSSPAVVGGRIYFTAVHGKVYCVDAATMTQIWSVNLKQADAAYRQPVTGPLGDSWSSPLVVNGRVYVASGEGEYNTFGYVYCLNAATGAVIWLFCTNQFQAGVENSPNVIPASHVGLSPLPAGFSSTPDPAAPGASPWSSAAYDPVLDRIYIATGNSRPDNPLPDPRYASGVLSLDATTGQFRAFFQPAQSDSYRPLDWDVDIPAAPMIFDRGDRRLVAIGSKNGSFFLLDTNTLAVVERRQLLPRNASTGGPIATVAPTGSLATQPNQNLWSGENKWGVMATAALNDDLGRLYVGIGGYAGIGDQAVTPFIRALDWNTLADAWPTATVTVGGTPVVKYSMASPPLYTSTEAGLASPAVANDVVFMSTSKTALYALSAQTGLCLWAAPSMPSGGYCLGPAIYGDYVVVGARQQVNIYRLPRRRFEPPVLIDPWWRIRHWPWPPPDPWDPFPGPFPGPGPGPGPDPAPIEPGQPGIG